MKDLNLFGEDITEFELIEDSEEQFREYEQVQNTSVLSFDNAASLLLTKATIQSFAERWIQSVTDGHENPLKTAAILNGLETALKAIREGIKDIVVDSCKEAGKGSYQGVKIEKMEAGGKYDYLTCKDVIYNGLSSEMEALDIKIKERQKFLKALPKDGLTITDEATGETWKAMPPIKPATTTTYKVTIPNT